MVVVVVDVVVVVIVGVDVVVCTAIDVSPAAGIMVVATVDALTSTDPEGVFSIIFSWATISVANAVSTENAMMSQMSKPLSDLFFHIFKGGENESNFSAAHI